jgi:hypothetical protein
LFTHLRLGLPSGLFTSGFPHQYTICSPLHLHSCYMPCSSHPPWLDYSNYSWRRVQVMKFLIMQFRLSKESVQVRGFLRSFVTSLFLWWRVVSPTPNSSARGPPLVGCPRLLIQCICSYPPYLEVVSSIRNMRTRHVVVTREPSNMESL